MRKLLLTSLMLFFSMSTTSLMAYRSDVKDLEPKTKKKKNIKKACSSRKRKYKGKKCKRCSRNKCKKRRVKKTYAPIIEPKPITTPIPKSMIKSCKNCGQENCICHMHKKTLNGAEKICRGCGQENCICRLVKKDSPRKKAVVCPTCHQPIERCNCAAQRPIDKNHTNNHLKKKIVDRRSVRCPICGLKMKKNRCCI